MTTRTLKRNIFQRILGIPATKPPADPGCWSLSGTELILDLSRVPELAEPWGAIHIEGQGLSSKVLVLLDGEGTYRAFRNQCEHGGRKIDPVPGTETVQCCSVGQSVFNYDGSVVSGSAEKPIKVFPVRIENGTLLISIE